MLQKFLRAIDFVIYWSIALIPFFMAIAPAPVYVFMGLLFFCFILKKLIKKESLLLKTPLNTALLCFFLITCVSLINSISYRDSIKGGVLRLIQYIFIFLIIASEVKDKKQIRTIIGSMCFGLALVGLDEIWQVFTGRDFIRGYVPVFNIGLVRATASFKDPNTIGVYLSAIAPLIFGLALFYLKGAKKIIFVIIGILAILGIALTYSRPTLLAMYIALFLFGFLKRSKALIIILTVIALAAPFLAPRSVKDWAKQVNYNPLRLMCNDDRIAIYRNSFNMIKAHPIIGVGANTFMKNYKQYKEKPEYMNIVTLDYAYAHNNFFQLTAELGFIGLSIFIWLLYMLFSRGIAIYRRLNDEFLKITMLSLIICLAAFLINGLTESSLYSSRVAMIFWYLMGLSMAFNKFTNADKQ